jgi:hypothetical protein
MPTLDFPRDRIGLVHELAVRLLDGRKPGTRLDSLARGLYHGFFAICIRSGLDGLLVALAEAHPPLDPADPDALADHPTLLPALVARLEAIDLDGGAPRNLRPGQLADCTLGGLGLTLADRTDRPVALDDTVRVEVAAALSSAVEVELAVPRIREAIVAHARERCELRYRGALDKVVAQLDERGLQVLKQPNLPLDAVQAVQRLLFDARNAVIEQASRVAIDRAKAAIARTDLAAAERIDQPVTHRLTPRDVAILRACDPSVPRVPAAVAAALLASLTELARIAWRAPVRIARKYSPRETFAVGELLDHPTFGQGNVTAAGLQKIEVEFADGKRSFVHAKK